jgi:hypothetical protein
MFGFWRISVVFVFCEGRQGAIIIVLSMQEGSETTLFEVFFAITGGFGAKT